jgi:hypothetical protein
MSVTQLRRSRNRLRSSDLQPIRPVPNHTNSIHCPCPCRYRQRTACFFKVCRPCHRPSPCAILCQNKCQRIAFRTPSGKRHGNIPCKHCCLRVTVRAIKRCSASRVTNIIGDCWVSPKLLRFKLFFALANHSVNQSFSIPM